MLSSVWTKTAFRLLTCFLFLVVAISGYSQSGGPPGGVVVALAVNPVTPTTIYAGTDDNGVFKSTNSGIGWTAVNTGLTNLSTEAVAINPSTTSTVYAATTVGGVFKSTNSGA